MELLQEKCFLRIRADLFDQKYRQKRNIDDKAASCDTEDRSNGWRKFRFDHKNKLY